MISHSPGGWQGGSRLVLQVAAVTWCLWLVHRKPSSLKWYHRWGCGGSFLSVQPLQEASLGFLTTWRSQGGWISYLLAASLRASFPRDKNWKPLRPSPRNWHSATSVLFCWSKDAPSFKEKEHGFHLSIGGVSKNLWPSSIFHRRCQQIGSSLSHGEDKEGNPGSGSH